MTSQENISAAARYDIANAPNLLGEIREGLKPRAPIENVLYAANQTANGLWGDEQVLLEGALTADPIACIIGSEEGYEYSCWTVPETTTPAGRALAEVFQRDTTSFALEGKPELNLRSYAVGFVIGATQGRIAGNGRSATEGDNA